MQEEILKVYDNLFNQIGAEPRSVVHEKGLLHQVVHLWMLEKERNVSWLYFKQRSKENKVFPGLYDLICSGHIDPEETFKDAMIRQAKSSLGLSLDENKIEYMGHIHQMVDKANYHDNAFCQIYSIQVVKPVFHINGIEQVVKVNLNEFKSFILKEIPAVTIYNTDGNPIKKTTSNDWWLREKEFLTVILPYIEK
jgi:isopentenyldiphosphate isomerase